MPRSRGEPSRTPPGKALGLATSLGILRSIVRQKLRYVGPVALLEARGYRWWSRRYLPALEHLASVAKTREPRRLAADAFYALGDLYDFLEAPLAAVRAYQRCIDLEPQAGGAWRELGNMLASMGSADEARRALRRALRCNPSDSNAREDLAWLEEDPDSLHRYRAGDACWEANEALAHQRPQEALARLQGRRSVRARLVRLRALGVLEQNERALQEWRELAATRGRISFNWGEWFFLPDRLFEDPAFWEALDAIADRLEPGVFSVPESLSIAMARRPRPSERPPQEAFTDSFRLAIGYNLARLRQDLRLARKVSQACPSWSAAAGLVARLEARKSARAAAAHAPEHGEQ